MKVTKLIGVALAAMVSLIFIAGHANAASSITDPTTVYSNSSSPAASGIGDILVQEVGNAGFGDGYFTVVIPSDVKLATTGSGTGSAGTTITRSTSVLGSSSSPKSLVVQALTTNSTAKGVIALLSGNSYFGLLNVYGSSAMCYGTASSTGLDTNMVQVVDFQTASATFTRPATHGTSVKVGEIYFNDSTNETVITLAGNDTNLSSSEGLWLNDMYLTPASTNTTGTVNLSVKNGKADGTAGIGITDDTGVKVMIIVDQPASVAASKATTFKTGDVAAPMGQVKVTMVGGYSTTTQSTIKFSLNNNAKFHTNANDPTSSITASGLDAADVASNWSVDSNGALVFTISSSDMTQVGDTDSFTIASGTQDLIDASSVTDAGTITATVTGTGHFASLSTSVAVATAATSGVSVSFEDGTTSGYTSLYSGRNNQELGSGEYVLVGEDAPSSLLAGGSVTFALNLGAKFQTGATVDIDSYTTSPYTDTTFATSGDITVGAAATSVSMSVNTASASARGAFTFGKSGSNFLDLRSAGAGDLTATISGTAGASGTVTMATVIDATITTVADPITVVPGDTVTLPDITITEGAAGALNTGLIGMKFPTGFSIDKSAASVAVTGATAGSTTGVSINAVDSDDATFLTLSVTSQSTSSTGLFTIVVSGLTATTTSSVSSGDVNVIVGGASSKTYSSASSSFDSNTGAAPTYETVAFGATVDDEVPYIGTATVVGNTVTQTMIGAGDDLGKVADIYVFTGDQEYYDGSTWSTTEAAYESGITLGTHTIVYDTTGLGTNTKIYIGHGVGIQNTVDVMSVDGTFALAYTTPSSQDVGKDTGETKVDQNVDDAIELYLNITNDDNYDPATDFVYEWLIFGATVGGADAGLFFYSYDGTDYGVHAYDASLDLTTVTYQFDHSSDYFKITDLNMGTLGMSAGDQFWYGYVYGLTGFDLADTSTWNLENYTFITAK